MLIIDLLSGVGLTIMHIADTIDNNLDLMIDEVYNIIERTYWLAYFPIP